MNQEEQPRDEQQPVVPPPVPEQSTPVADQQPVPENPQPVAPIAPAPTPAPIAPPRPVEQPPTQASEPRNFLVALLMTVSFGFYGLHQVYLGRKTQGWIRFALALLAYPLSFVYVGLLIIPVLAVWTIVDFFTLYLGKRVDADGQALTVTSRDNAWAKTIFIVALVMGALYVVMIVVAIMIVTVSGILSRSALDSTPNLESKYYNFSDSSY